MNLKPCPFCGGEAHIEHGLVTWAVVCPCSSHVFYGCEKDKAKTVEAWNTRAERTCHYVGDEISGGCSECRGWLDPACAYCPSCGAKVVDE